MSETKSGTTVPYLAKVQLVNNWSLGPEVREFLDRHFLVHITGIEVADKLEQGEIRWNDIWYKVNWLTLPNECFRSKNLQLSFRRLTGSEFGYVLIRKTPEEKGDKQ